MDIPDDVLQWLRAIFAGCNERITEKLSLNPNIPEESLDLTWIEHLSRFSTPNVFPSGWVGQLETHYLGGLRHWHRWEVADIGVLLFVRSGGEIVKSKVVLLQSKRLYPTNRHIAEEGIVDYRVGFARLADPEVLKQRIAVRNEFVFSVESRYGAIIPDSDQVKAINDYQTARDLKVYYQLYNPWSVPFTQRVPLEGSPEPPPDTSLGVRILPADTVHALLEGRTKADRPRLKEFAAAEDEEKVFGWPLEEFVVDEFLACREGNEFDSLSDERIQTLFFRRTGPIAAAIAITIEQATIG